MAVWSRCRRAWYFTNTKDDISISPPIAQAAGPGGDGLWLVSSNLNYYPNGGSTTFGWFGEVENRSDRQICEPRVDLTFINAASLSFHQMSVWVSAPAYVGGLPTKCLEAGESAPFAFQTSSSLDHNVMDAQTLTAELRAWNGAEYTMVIDPAAPTLEDLTIQESGFGGWNINGFYATGDTALISVYVKFFPRTSDGFIGGQLGSLEDGHLIAADSRFEFNTSEQADQFTSFLSAVEFIKAPQ